MPDRSAAPAARIVIVGGGLAGLTAAYTLCQIADASLPWHCTLLEAAPRLGGKVATERVDGFVMERGPDAFLGTKPWGVALCDALGLTPRLVQTNVATRKAYELRGDTLHELPPSVTPPMLSFQHGMQELTDALARAIDTHAMVTTRTNAAVRRIVPLRDADGTVTQYAIAIDGAPPLHADAVILATPGYDAARMLCDADPVLSAILDAIPYDDISAVMFAYRADDVPVALDGHGYLVPPNERTPITGCTWTSTKFPGRAPDGYRLLRCFVRNTDAWCDSSDDDALIAIARAELRHTLRITTDPVRASVSRWHRGLPLYGADHPQRLQAAQARLQALPGIVLAGAGYHGVGIPDCIHDGDLAARAAWSSVASRIPSLHT